MKALRRPAIMAQIVLGTVFAACGLEPSARGQTAQPNVKISDPASNSSVTVGPGSAQLGVKFKVNNGYYPTSVKLIYTDANGNPVNDDTTTNFCYDGVTSEYTALLSVPAGTTTGVKINVRAYLPP